MSNFATVTPSTQATRAVRVKALQGMLARLQAEGGESAGKDVINMLGGSKKGENHPHFFSEAINAQIDAWGLTVDGLFHPNCNPKATMRLIQFVGAVRHETYSQVDRTTACVILALHLAGDFPLTTGALWEVATGGKVKSEGMGENRRGVSCRTVARLIGAVGTSTVETQLSRSVGRNGFLQAVGATQGEPGKQNRPVTMSRSHPMIRAFLGMIEKGTEGQIKEMIKD